MSADRQARSDLRNALLSYMTGETHAFAFGDKNSEYCRTTDSSLQQISRFLYLFHDATIDHPISVSPQGWAVLRRIVAFLGTDLEIAAAREEPAWPFHNEEQWHANEYLVTRVNLPEYDPIVHAREIHPWWNRIPSSVGFLLLAAVILAVIVALFVL